MDKEYQFRQFNYQDVTIDVRFDLDNNTVWLSQEEMAKLFKKSKSSISRYLKTISDNHSKNIPVVAKYATTGADGKIYKINHFDLETIKFIGYRIDIDVTTIFCNWCMDTIKEFTNQNQSIKSELIRFENEGVSIDVRVLPDENTVLLAQEQLAILFATSKQNISHHISDIFESEELEKVATVKEFLTVQNENGRMVNRYISYYNLDMIISIGYRVNTKRGIAFRRWANKVLKQYLLTGYAINDKRVLVTNENYLNLINRVDGIDNRLRKLEKESSLDFPTDRIFLNNQLFEAKALLIKLICSANISLTIIDAYADDILLDILTYKKKEVKVLVITSYKTKIKKPNIALFNKTYKNLSLVIDNSFHDRYLIIDDLLFYHLGSSINYLGKRLAQMTKIMDDYIIRMLKERIGR